MENEIMMNKKRINTIAVPKKSHYIKKKSTKSENSETYEVVDNSE